MPASGFTAGVLGAALAAAVLSLGACGSSPSREASQTPSRTQTAGQTRIVQQLMRTRGGVRLVYELAIPGAGATHSAAVQAGAVLNQRAAALDATARASADGANHVVLEVPGLRLPVRAVAEIGRVSWLAFYDWEANVIGPGGRPAPGNGAVTGDARAQPGTATAGLMLYDAVLRGAARPPSSRPNRSTDGTFYLLDRQRRSVLAGPQDSPKLLPAAAAATHSQVVAVPAGTVIVRAVPAPDASANAAGSSPERYYVLNDDPALSGSEVTDPKQGVDNVPGAAGAPNVSFSFTSTGQSAFRVLTRTLAQRGALASTPGAGPQQAFHHFAIVLGDRLLSVPYVDYRTSPDGIDAARGSQIEGGLTAADAAKIAREMRAGSLPARLKLLSVAQVPPR